MTSNLPRCASGGALRILASGPPAAEVFWADAALWPLLPPTRADRQEHLRLDLGQEVSDRRSPQGSDDDLRGQPAERLFGAVMAARWPAMAATHIGGSGVAWFRLLATLGEDLVRLGRVGY